MKLRMTLSTFMERVRRSRGGHCGIGHGDGRNRSTVGYRYSGNNYDDIEMTSRISSR